MGVKVSPVLVLQRCRNVDVAVLGAPVAFDVAFVRVRPPQKSKIRYIVGSKFKIYKEIFEMRFVKSCYYEYYEK